MTCTRIKEYIQELFVSGGFELPQEIKEHLDSCHECRAFAEDLTALSRTLAPLGDIALTAEEAARLEADLSALFSAEARKPVAVSPEGKIAAIARMALAAAAVLILMMMPWDPDFPSQVNFMPNTDDLHLTRIDEMDMASLFTDGETDLLPSIVDNQSAVYLTDQVQPGQADDILEKLTPEELEWLMENVSMEI